MAVGESYPVIILNANGDEIAGNTVQFTDSTDQPLPNTGAALAGTSLSLTGLTGAVTAVRYVGGTATVAPTTGTFVAGDFVISVNGSCWICTVGGTPGTWVQAGSVLLAAKASPTFTGTVIVPAAAGVTSATKLADLSSYLTITSGTLPDMGAWVSGTAKQNPVARQIKVNVECVFDGTNNVGSVAILVSPDNVTFTTVGTPSVGAAINNLAASTVLVPVTLPNAWYIKLTIGAHATVAASFYY